ncbi:esterase/lipase family protein [Streptomyces sp. NPDC096319]|uniref:esterase/lipase family protein n=1 Tax=Streptomyces sp. NPDC096319 TaxID=3366084 RepID=UPI003823CEAB
MEHDLVVFVPGFLGTRLCRDGRDVWARCGERLMSSGAAALTEAALPPGLGDALPEGPFRLDADTLLRIPDSVPGLLSCMGYPDLRAALADPLDAQFVPFGYDWRLSHRLVARQLKERVARELERWRAEVDAYYPDRADDPRVILVCHATGGLIGRHYLEREEGRETARTLVTLGTPQHGLVQAARLLAGHAVPVDAGPGADVAARLNGALRDWALHLPAVVEMLPVYPAVRVEGKSRERHVTDGRYPVPGLPGDAVREALAFQEEFRSACDEHRGAGPLPYAVHCLGSADFPSPEALVLSSDGARISGALPGPGDGTVPRRSALADWTGTDPMLWTGFRNADLASGPALRDAMLAIRAGRPPGGMLAGEEGIVLYFPGDVVAAGRPFVVELLGHDLPRRNLRTFVWRSGRNDRHPVAFRQHGPDRYRAELVVPPGRWVVEALVDRPKGRDRRDVTVVAA